MPLPLPDPFGALEPAKAPDSPKAQDSTPAYDSSRAARPAERIAALVRSGEAAVAEVDALLARARRRAFRQALARAGLLAASSLLLSTLLAALLSARLGPLPGRVAYAVLLAVSGAAFVLFWRRSPLQRAAAAARDPRRLAALLCDPALGAAAGSSDLLSSVELVRAELPGTSRELLALLHMKAAGEAHRLDLGQALPGSALRRPLLALLVAFVCVVAAAIAAPRVLHLGLLRLWLGDAAAPPAELEPIAGDLSITYLYPAYTGLPPRVEEGTAGDLRAPKGTEVKLAARADRDLDTAFAVYNDQAIKLEATGPGHRSLSGSLSLRAPGAWHLRFADQKGRAVAEGPPRPVEIVSDQPPAATISEPAKSELEVDPLGKIPLVWSATDDYGLAGAWLVFQRPGETEERIPLGAPPAEGVNARRLSGTYGWEMAPLKLRAGDRVTFHVEAQDQDAIDGPKKGVSAIHTLKIFSAAEHHREALLRAQQLWERLIVHLADRLEEKAPPAPLDEAVPWYQAMTARDRQAMGLVADLGAAGRELGKDKLAPPALGRALKYVQSSLSPLVQRTAIARAPLSKGSSGREGALHLFQNALAGEVRELEKDVLYLEDLLDQARLEDLQELQKELAQSRRELTRLAEKLRKAPDEATKKQLLSEVSRLRERVQELMKRMAEMAKGIRDEHLNKEAVEAVEKEQDLMSQLSEVQRKLQSGDVDAALKQLDELSQQLEKLEGSLKQQSDARGEQKYAEEAKALKDAAGKLGKLKEREQALEKRTGALRREEREQAKKRFEQHGGKDLSKRLEEKAAQARRQIAQIDPKVAEPLGLEEMLDGASQRAEDLERALKSGDLEEALDQAQRAERMVELLQSRLGLEDQIRQLRQPAEVRKSLEGAVGAGEPLREVVRALQDSLPREGQGMSPEQQKELRSQQAEQKEIKDGMQGVRDQLSQVGKKVPIFGPQHEQLLQEAQGAMEGAEQKLGRGEPRGAQAGETQAMEKIEKFEQAMKEMAKQGGGGAGMPMPWGEPQGTENGEEEGDGSDTRHDHVEIPDAEASRGPQEFRKKLLDAMKQPPPEKFKERVKQYYEELVK
jgi:hypothetical protein